MKTKKIGIGIFIIYLCINLFLLKDYGLSWDYHYHHFAGLYHLGKDISKVSDFSLIPFSSPDSRLTVEDPFGPFTQIIPSLSQIILSEKFKLLPFDISYNLPGAVFGSLGVLVLYLFLFETFGQVAAVAGSLALALNPVYFGYLHNNMKDTPNSFAFALSIWLFWRLTKYKNFTSLVMAAAAFAFAFNIKINSIFIPVICGLYYLPIFSMAALAKARNVLIKDRFVLLYFLLAPLLAVLVWLPFWPDPFKKLIELPKFYSLNTYNMPVLFFGSIYHSGINIPAVYPYAYLAITTPLSILFFAFTGLICSLVFIIKKKTRYLIFLIWFFVPLLRYLNPKNGAIDGVRHFMEVLYPLSAFAGIGFWLVFKKIKPELSFFIGIILFTFLIANVINFHPYQTSFFNPVIGGIKGAQGRFDIDFWGTPQKEAVLWLNNNAPGSAYIHIVMAQSTASVYLREDLLKNVNKKTIEESDYVVLLNRQSFFNLYGVQKLPQEKESSGKIVYAKKIDGIPLVWVFRK